MTTIEVRNCENFTGKSITNCEKLNGKSSSNNNDDNSSLITLYENADNVTPIIRTVQSCTAGAVLITEEPLIFGPIPKKPPKGYTVCVGCYKLLPQNGVDLKQCIKCKWPICHTHCTGLTQSKWHSRTECRILGKSRITSNYPMEVLTSLRAIVHLQSDTEKWMQLLKFGSDLLIAAKDENKPHLGNDFQEKLQLLTMILNNSQYELKPSEDTIRKLLCSIQLFGIEVSINERHKIWSIYPQVAHIRHSCVPNSTACYQFDQLTAAGGLTVTLRSVQPLTANSELTLAHVHLLLGTHARRDALRKRYGQRCFHHCNCQRCRDPSEFGTMLSGLRCYGTDENNDCGGIQLPLQPQDFRTKWLCNKCTIALPNKDIGKFVRHLSAKTEKCFQDAQLNDLEELLIKLLHFLHPNHYLVVRVKMALILNVRSEADISVKQCTELLNIIEKLDTNRSQLWLEYSRLLYKKIQLTTATKDQDSIKDLKGLLAVRQQIPAARSLYELICKI